MKIIRAAVAEFLGMFIDDGSLALAIVAMIALVTIGVKIAGIAPIVGGVALLLGCALLLVESVYRAARRKMAKTR
jgi:hypothetical protein